MHKERFYTKSLTPIAKILIQRKKIKDKSFPHFLLAQVLNPNGNKMLKEIRESSSNSNWRMMVCYLIKVQRLIEKFMFRKSFTALMTRLCVQRLGSKKGKKCNCLIVVQLKPYLMAVSKVGGLHPMSTCRRL